MLPKRRAPYNATFQLVMVWFSLAGQILAWQLLTVTV